MGFQWVSLLATDTTGISRKGVVRVKINHPRFSHMEGAQVPPQQVVYVQQAPMLNAKSSGLAIVLAFLWPGLDYFYLEDGSGGVKRAIGCAFLLFTIIGIPVALIIWIMGLASSSRRTAEFNNNLMMQNQGTIPNQQIVQQ